MADFAVEADAGAGGAAGEAPITENYTAVTDAEASSSILIENIKDVGDDEKTESSLVQLAGAFGEIKKMLLQHEEEQKMQRCIMVYANPESAVNAAKELQGQSLFDTPLKVMLVADLPQPEHTQGGAAGGADASLAGEGESMSDNTAPPQHFTSAELVGNLLGKGYVMGRKGVTNVREIDNEKVGVQRFAARATGRVKSKWSEVDEKLHVSDKVGSAVDTMGQAYDKMGKKIIALDEQYHVQDNVVKAAKKATDKAKEAADMAMQNKTVAGGVKAIGGAWNKFTHGVSEWGSQAKESATESKSQAEQELQQQEQQEKQQQEQQQLEQPPQQEQAPVPIAKPVLPPHQASSHEGL